MSSAEWTATARWIFPVAGPSLERGTLTIAGERISSVNSAGERTADIDFGNAAILPGFVNAHTHLDLSGMRGQCPPTSDFTAWLRKVIQDRRSRTAQQVHADIAAGVAECIRTGTTLLGDISHQGQSWTHLLGAPLRSVLFHEVLGLTVDRAAASWQQYLDWLGTRGKALGCRAGLSLHAPYSVRNSLFTTAANYIRQHAAPIPVAIHLAESAAEQELLNRHTGPFVGFLKELGVWDPDGLIVSPDEVISGFSIDARVLWVHANFLAPQTAVARGGTIVYCPRTHAAFGHPPHPFRDFLARGIRVALGTDSLASNPDLDILGEARFVHRRYPDVSGATLLRMLTLSGAEALGWELETGSLVPGKSADFVVLPLANAEPPDPHTLIFQAEHAPKRTFFRGC